MSEYKNILLVLILNFLASCLHLIDAHPQNAHICHAPMICSGSLGRETQWREIEMNGIKGDRGSPGKKGPPGPPGSTTIVSNNGAIQQMADRLERIERNLVESFEAKLLNTERRANESAEQLEQLRQTMKKLQDNIQWGSVAYEASNGFSYKITRRTQNFQQSREECRRMGGHLAYIGIRNASIHSEIMQDLKGGWAGLIIDLTDTETEGVFRWRDGVLASQGWTHWNSGEPNNAEGREHCTSIGTDERHTWNDFSCTESNRHALCERRIA